VLNKHQITGGGVYLDCYVKYILQAEKLWNSNGRGDHAKNRGPALPHFKATAGVSE